MSGGMYLIRDDGQLVEMNEQPYDSESLLQELLASYPNLLAGDQIDSFTPRRWLLLSREAPLPSDEGGNNRWWVDHVFLDQDAVPTLVEVKRSSDTRIRREVVGQMLDYAANAIVYWPVERLRSWFEAVSIAQGSDPGQALGEFLRGEIEPETYWQNAKTNLQAGRIRMIFVADKIPAELQRIVEFLNQQMDPAEVLAVEIKQYVGQGLKTLVPRVLGQTSEAQKKKPGAAREDRSWDEASFLEELKTKRGADDARIARKILEWTRARELRIWWGRGVKDGSFFPMPYHKEAQHWLISV